jgi:dihydropyrimidine dehydrogenase (NAD+) subunit PreT
VPLNEPLVFSTAVAAVLLTIVAVLWTRRRRASIAGGEAMRLAIAEGQHIPPSLHPVIDPTICIGSFSCIKACPEGDIIGVVDGVATLVEAAHCIGHSRCALDCPVGAIKLVFGTAERGVDLPETDERFESSRPGVYVIGELGGMGLIKNALRQGLDVGRALKERLKKTEAQGTLVDVVIVGGGPAGIACAVGVKQQGLVARVFEQETLGGCVAHYPRGKVVMTEQVHVPSYGKFGQPLISKEVLLSELQKMIAANQLKIEEGHKVVKVEGDAPMFAVTTSRGTTVHARAVVLATGLRGSPRKLGCQGEELPKVTYRLIDPEQYHGQRVLVVGGGDSAVEAAIQLAEESTAKVSISYRQDSFSRCKQRNREKIARLIEEGRVRPLLSTEVIAIEEGLVRLKTKEGEGRLKNDKVIVSVGGEVPTEFLKSIGVSIKKYKGEEKGAEKGAAQKPGAPPTKAQIEARTRRRFAITLFALGAAIIAGLLLVGNEYYWLPVEERAESPLHPLLKPSGLWGHGVGVAATTFMMANFLYAVRKRWKRLKGKTSIRTWLTFHMFVGIMSPLVIAFHAAFLMNNLLAVWTWVALAVVVGTGVFGRFLFGLVPAQAGKVLALSEVREQLNDIASQVEPRLEEATNAELVRSLFAQANEPPRQRSFLRALLEEPAARGRLARQLTSARPYFLDERTYSIFRRSLLQISRSRLQIAFYGALKRLFRGWLVIHVVLAVFMVVLIAAHVSVTLYLGYGWIFTEGA